MSTDEDTASDLRYVLAWLDSQTLAEFKRDPDGARIFAKSQTNPPEPADERAQIVAWLRAKIDAQDEISIGFTIGEARALADELEADDWRADVIRHCRENTP